MKNKKYYIMITPEMYNEATGNSLTYPRFANIDINQYVDLDKATSFEEADVALSQICEPWEIVVRVDEKHYPSVEELSENWKDYIDFNPIIPEYAFGGKKIRKNRNNG